MSCKSHVEYNQDVQAMVTWPETRAPCYARFSCGFNSNTLPVIGYNLQYYYAYRHCTPAISWNYINENDDPDSKGRCSELFNILIRYVLLYKPMRMKRMFSSIYVGVLVPGSCIASIFLTIAIIIYLYFKSLRCIRNRIHINLFLACLLKYLSLIVLYSSVFFYTLGNKQQMQLNQLDTEAYEYFKNITDIGHRFNLSNNNQSLFYTRLFPPKMEIICPKTTGNISSNLTDEIYLNSNKKYVKVIKKRQKKKLFTIFCRTIFWLERFSTIAIPFWMLIEGVSLYNQFVANVLTSQSKNSSLIYYIFGWGSPLVLSCLLIYFSENDSIKSKGQPNNNYCVQTTKSPYNWLLYGPVLILIVVNMGLLVRILYVVAKKTNVNGNVRSLNKRITKKSARSSLDQSSTLLDKQLENVIQRKSLSLALEKKSLSFNIDVRNRALTNDMDASQKLNHQSSFRNKNDERRHSVLLNRVIVPIQKLKNIKNSDLKLESNGRKKFSIRLRRGSGEDHSDRRKDLLFRILRAIIILMPILGIAHIVFYKSPISDTIASTKLPSQIENTKKNENLNEQLTQLATSVVSGSRSNTNISTILYVIASSTLDVLSGILAPILLCFSTPEVRTTLRRWINRRRRMNANIEL